MNIEKLLDYQKADREYDELIKERNATPDVDNYLKAKRVRDFARQSLVKLSADNQQTHAQLERLTAAQDEISEEVEAILESINNLNNEGEIDEDEINYLAQRLDDLSSEIDKIAKDVAVISERVSALKKECDKNTSNGEKSVLVLKTLNEAVKKILDEYKPKEDELTEKKNAIKAGLTREEQETYEKVKQAKKGGLPAVLVPLFEDSFCGGCRREIPGAQLQKLNDEGYIFCQECSRIVYKKK